MVKKHTFPELSRDLWGVICNHHWYPRAGLEGRAKSYFSKKELRIEKMQNYPLSIFHVAVRPESLPGADLATFQKVMSIICFVTSLSYTFKRARFIIKHPVMIPGPTNRYHHHRIGFIYPGTYGDGTNFFCS